MKAFILGALAFLAAGAGFAQTPQPSLVNVNMDNGPLTTLAATLSQQSRTRVLVAPGAAGKVTLHLESATVETAVKTAAVILKLKWRVLWLGPEVAPRIRAEQAARIALALDSVGSSPVAISDGRKVSAFKPEADTSVDTNGLRPVYIFLPLEQPTATGQPTPVAAPEPQQMAPSDDPEVAKVQRAFGGLSPEQQLTFYNNVRSYLRPQQPGNGRNRGGATTGTRNNNRRRNRPTE